MTASILKTLLTRGREEDGAVTVDWVVLTAMIAGLGMAVAGSIWVQVGTANNKISSFIDTQTVATTF
jgi:hypothetical protein